MMGPARKVADVAEVTICELGPLRIRVAELVADVAGERAAAVLVLLSMAGPHGIRTEALLEQAWPSPGQPVSARHSLANVVARFRQQHGRAFIESTGRGYRLGSHVRSDRREFLRMLDHAEALVEDEPAKAHELASQALTLWRGEPWHGLETPEGVEADRAHLFERRLDALQVTVNALSALDRTPESLESLTELVEARPGVERNWLMLAQLESEQGSRPAALSTINRARRALAATGLEVSDELVRYEQLLIEPPLDTSSQLPTSSTPLLGRSELLDAVMRLLEDGTVVTLVGPGGVGKTRLAIEVARQQGRLPTMFVDYVPVRDGALFADTLASALGAPPARLRPPIDAVIRELSRRPRLVILDNCEHLVEAAAEVTARIANACPASRVLVTSRESLSIRAELVVVVEPLSIGPYGPSVELFFRRAAQCGVHLDVDALRPDVARLCAALDGLPLAIELAASRSTVLGPKELLDALHDRFDLLQTPRGEGRHKSLHGTIMWSWEQLDDDDRLVLSQLSVFASSLAISGIAEVLGQPYPMVVDRVDRLTQKSLTVIARDEPEVTRVNLLDSIRHFAIDQAQSAGTYEALIEAHLRWVDQQTVAAIGVHGGNAGSTGYLKLDAVRHDIRSALDRAGNGGNATVGLVVCERIFNWWRGRGLAREGAARLIALDSESTPLASRVDAAACAATLARIANHSPAEVAMLTSRARALMTDHLEPDVRVRSEVRLLEAEFDDGDPDLPDRLLAVINAPQAGANEVAIGLHLLTAWTVANDPQRAPARADETFAASEIAGEACLGHAMELRGLAQLANDRPGTAVDHLLDAINLFETIGQRFCALHCCESIAWWTAASGDLATAAGLLAATEGIRLSADRTRSGFEQQAISGAIGLLGVLPEADTEATIESVVERARNAIGGRN